jgi:hypothetical protein
VKSAITECQKTKIKSGGYYKMFLAKVCFLLSIIMLILSMVTRFLGYGTKQGGAPWAFGITPDAYLRFANTLVLYTIALGLMYWINIHPAVIP